MAEYGGGADESWDCKVSIIGNFLVLKELLKVFGVAFALLWLVGEGISWMMKTSMTLYVLKHPIRAVEEAQPLLWSLLALGIISGIIVAIVFSGGYKARFGVDEEKAWMEPQPGQREMNERIYTLLFGLGAVSGNPGAMGTALIARSTQSKQVFWRDIRKVVAYPNRQVVALYDDWHCTLQIYCLPDNYQRVLQLAKRKTDS